MSWLCHAQALYETLQWCWISHATILSLCAGGIVCVYVHRMCANTMMLVLRYSNSRLHCIVVSLSFGPSSQHILRKFGCVTVKKYQLPSTHSQPDIKLRVTP